MRNLFVLLLVFLIGNVPSTMNAGNSQKDSTEWEQMLKTEVTVSSTSGDVMFRPSPKKDWQPLKMEQNLKIPAQIRTGEKSRVAIRHNNGVIRIIGEKETIDVYQIIAHNKPIQDDKWTKSTWRDICRILSKEKKTLKNSSKISDLRGDYRVDWSSYNFSSLYWKDTQNVLKNPTLFHIQSAIYAMEELFKTAELGEKSEKAELRYLIAECELMIGNETEAKEQFRQVQKNYPNTNWSKKAKDRLKSL
ncbi:MAG: hypothetical protein B6244_07270 [Candidatus Cloacimonetes bacterium 4572_55]|nr:MAG: hypothetical protein B6244_07270 [Candidatus Cloacimonetes bacterium 4572_55]